MSFWGLDFVFDNQYSDNYGLKIMKIGDSSITSEDTAGCGLEIFADAVNRNPVLYHQGVAQNEPLEFDIEFVSEEELHGLYRSKIYRWLFGRMDYCKLQIIQRDLENIYFNCHLINPTTTYVGNVCHGIKCTVQCDAPWAWEYPRTYRYDDLRNKGMSSTNALTYRFFNDSDDNDYTYPIIRFRMSNASGKNCSIVNVTDGNRECRFSGMSANEEVEVNCRSQTITSSTGLAVSDKFNKHFFRLMPGVNTLKLQGEFEYLTITCRNARKVGG